MFQHCSRFVRPFLDALGCLNAARFHGFSWTTLLTGEASKGLLQAGLHLAELHLLEEFLSRFLFRALALAVLVPASYSWAQIASSSALLAKDGSAGANSAGSNNAGSDSTSTNNTSLTNISPNPVALNNQESRVAPDLPPQPKGKTTLLGGKIRIVDHVRDRIVLDIFGGGHMTVLFDERTHVFRADQHGSLDDLKDGERAYVDTTLDGKDIFARNIRVLPAVPTGEGKGQIVEYDATQKGIDSARYTLATAGENAADGGRDDCARR